MSNEEFQEEQRQHMQRRKDAMAWWRGLGYFKQEELSQKVFQTVSKSLTGREIQKIWEKFRTIV